MIKKKLNIISPVFNEADNLDAFFNKLKNVKTNLEKSFDTNIIFVDDGSEDASQKTLKKLEEENNFIKTIFFTKNFGHQSAVFAGLSTFDADLYLVLDSDLQHDPSLIDLMIKNLNEFNCEIVQMKKKYSSYEGFFKRLSSKIFYNLFSKVSDISIESGSSDFFLITNKVRKEIINSKISHSFLRGFLHWSGYSKVVIEYEPNKRIAGRSSYNLLKQLEFALTGIYYYSNKLYLYLFILSSVILLGCIIYIIIILIDYFFLGGKSIFISGWTTLVILLLFFGSASVLFNSVMLFLLMKIFGFSGNKPFFIEKNKDKDSKID